MHSACQRATSSRRMRQLCGFITRAAHRTRHTHRPESSSGRPDRRRGRGRTPADSRRERRPRNGASPRLLAGHPPGGGHTRGLVRVMGLREGLDCVPPVWPEGPEGSCPPDPHPLGALVGPRLPYLGRPRQSASFRPCRRLFRPPPFPVVNDTPSAPARSIPRRPRPWAARSATTRWGRSGTICPNCGPKAWATSCPSPAHRRHPHARPGRCGRAPRAHQPAGHAVPRRD